MSLDAVLQRVRELSQEVESVDQEITERRGARDGLTSQYEELLKEYQRARQAAFQKFLDLVDPKYCSVRDHTVKRGRTRLVYYDYTRTFSHSCNECSPPDTHERFQKIHSACDEHILGADNFIAVSNGRIYIKVGKLLTPFPKPTGYGNDRETVSTPAFAKWFDYDEVQKSLPPPAETVEQLLQLIRKPS